MLEPCHVLRHQKPFHHLWQLPSHNAPQSFRNDLNLENETEVNKLPLRFQIMFRVGTYNGW